MKNKSKNKGIDSENKKYILKTKRDLKILNLCKKLEKAKLSKSDKNLIVLIKTQLERDWRIPLLKELKKILIKYRN